MIRVDVLDDREVDQLLEGQVPAGREELASLAAIVASIRAAFSGRHDRDSVMRQLPVVRRLAHLVTTDKGDPAAMPVSKADRPRRYEVSGLPKWRRSSVPALLTSLLSGVAGKVAVGAASVAAITGGVIAASPDDPQTSVVSTISETEDATTTTVEDTTTTAEATTTTAEATTTTTATTVATETETETDAVTEAEAKAGTEAETEAEDNHGGAVSAAAQDHSHDEECGNHGRYVSSVARGQAACTPPPGQAKKAEREAAAPAADPAAAAHPAQPEHPAEATEPADAADATEPARAAGPPDKNRGKGAKGR